MEKEDSKGIWIKNESSSLKKDRENDEHCAVQ